MFFCRSAAGWDGRCAKGGEAAVGVSENGASACNRERARSLSKLLSRLLTTKEKGVYCFTKWASVKYIVRVVGYAKSPYFIYQGFFYWILAI